MGRSTRGDDRDIRAGGVGIVACPHPHGSRQRIGIGYVGRLCLCQGEVVIDQHDFAEQRSKHQGIGRRRSDMARSDDRNPA